SQQADPANNTEPACKTAAASAHIEAPQIPVVKGEEVTVKTPLYTSVFNSAGGILGQFTLHKYKETIEPDSPDVELIGSAVVKGLMGMLRNRKSNWAIGSWGWATDINGTPVKSVDVYAENTKPIVFTGEEAGIRIKRVFSFDAATYLVREQVHLVNTGDQPVGGNLRFTLASS
ncbi:membrane protein insertase YidC, partial [Oceanidesulfovibrio marinus]